jgi:hypothetical protein
VNVIPPGHEIPVVPDDPKDPTDPKETDPALINTHKKPPIKVQPGKRNDEEDDQTIVIDEKKDEITVDNPITVGTVAPTARQTFTLGDSAAGALDAQTMYDAQTRAAMQGTPQEVMARAQAAAAQTAQTQSDAAIRQAVKGAKTAGAMGGQAALAGSGQGADAYGAGMQQGLSQYFDTTKLGATLGADASGRLSKAEMLKASQEQADASLAGQQDMAANSLAMSKYGMDLQDAQAKAALAAGIKQGKDESIKDFYLRLIGAGAALIPLISDRNLKESIEPKDITRGLDKIKGYAYKYKGNPRQEAGVMVQDLEKTPMKPAVIQTPVGKAIDPAKLSTMNTAALSEHEKRIKGIERMLKGLSGIPKGKE